MSMTKDDEIEYYKTEIDILRARVNDLEAELKHRADSPLLVDISPAENIPIAPKWEPEGADGY